MTEINSNPLIETQEEKKKNSNVKWFIGIIFLSFVALSTGSVNLFPSLIDQFVETLGFSRSVATLMLTGGTTIMYITLPAGIFMDRFGDDLTIIVSICIVSVSYLILFFVPSNNIIFLLVYWLMAFGSASLFIACLQITLSRNDAMKGISTPIVSSSLSLAFGLLFKIYQVGPSIFPKEANLVSGIKSVALFVLIVDIVCGLIARFMYIGFEKSNYQGGSFSKKTVLKDVRLYVLLFTMMLTVFDGMTVIAGGVFVWKLFDPTYTEASQTWSLPFSLINCFFTIGLSALLDYVRVKFDSTRTRIFALFWIIVAIFPLSIAYAFNATSSRVLFGIFISCMSIPFGLGLAQVPAMTSDIFGNDQYGFAFGIIQLGSIISALSTMPLMQSLGKSGMTALFSLVTIAHVIISCIWIFLKKEPKFETGESVVKELVP